MKETEEKIILSYMNEPKYEYEIGDRVSDTNLTVCGYLRLSTGEYRYYLQIGDSDNTLVISDRDIEFLAEYRLKRLRWMSDRNTD